ncbi:MAG: protein-glutamate O-methyltransferase, partial [Anaerolineae bacterium]|nr:protein-glutamate O-methyltransferase [Anaerolineae bacterium]
MTIEPTEPLLAQASELIEQRTGLAVGAQFRLDLKTILSELAHGDLPQFLAALRTSSDTAPEWQALLRALTIGETYFFRDAPTFERLRTSILPDLILERRQKGRYDLTIWSAGCAGGEEVYSIAILLHELLPDLQRWTIRLIGTDINAQALENAQKGVYRDWSFRHTHRDLQTRYFDLTPGGWQIKGYLQALPLFRQGNISQGAPHPACDLVFCRNTLLY